MIRLREDDPHEPPPTTTVADLLWEAVSDLRHLAETATLHDRPVYYTDLERVLRHTRSQLLSLRRQYLIWVDPETDDGVALCDTCAATWTTPVRREAVTRTPDDEFHLLCYGCNETVLFPYYMAHDDTPPAD